MQSQDVAPTNIADFNESLVPDSKCRPRRTRQQRTQQSKLPRLSLTPGR